jgi:hypothetical protein
MANRHDFIQLHLPVVLQRMAHKLQHWRGFQSIFGLGAAPVLEFAKN